MQLIVRIYYGPLKILCKCLNPFKVPETGTLNIHPDTHIITESDVYRLIFNSQLQRNFKTIWWRFCRLFAKIAAYRSIDPPEIPDAKVICWLFFQRSPAAGCFVAAIRKIGPIFCDIRAFQTWAVVVPLGKKPLFLKVGIPTIKFHAALMPAPVESTAAVIFAAVF